MAEQKVEATPAPAPSAADEKKSLVVKNAVGEFIRGNDLKVSSDLFDEDGLNGVLKAILKRAMERCKLNGRKTVMKQDL